MWVKREPAYFMLLVISFFQVLLLGLSDPFTMFLLLLKETKCNLTVSLYFSFKEMILPCTETKPNSRAWLKSKHSWPVFNSSDPQPQLESVKQSFSWFPSVFTISVSLMCIIFHCSKKASKRRGTQCQGI